METPQPGVNGLPGLSVTALLSRALSTLMQNPVLFFGLALIANLPNFVILFIELENPAPLQTAGGLLGLAIQGAMAYGVFHALQGRTVAMGDSIAHGMANLLPLLGIAILYGVCGVVGLMLLVVPGFIVMCMWEVAAPVCVVEKLGVMDSLKRSAQLTQGCRMQIFGVLLLCGLVGLGLGFGVTYLSDSMPQNMVVLEVVASVLDVFLSAYSGVMASVIYVELRGLKEGTTLDSLVRVFD